MVKMPEDVLGKVEKFTTNILKNEVGAEFVYHDYDHTFRVVAAAKRIGAKCALTNKELELVTIAAWFHDTGYSQSSLKHEEHGAVIARTFLESIDYTNDNIVKIEGCIMATMMPQNPKNLLEQVLCDADLYYLACDDYLEITEKLHKEMEYNEGGKISDASWSHMNYEFYNKHEYFTDFGKKKLELGKAKNLKEIKEGLREDKRIDN